jgi:S1-C subfamily serine protease
LPVKPVCHLQTGNAEKLVPLDHLLVVGHPNYRVGDSPIVTPGLVAGFRVKSGIRRIITDAPIVAGCSGGPVLDRSGAAVGIAVTGADSFSKARDTEDHGIIPISAIKLLLRT